MVEASSPSQEELDEEAEGRFLHGDVTIRNVGVYSYRPITVGLFDLNPMSGDPLWDIAVHQLTRESDGGMTDHQQFIVIRHGESQTNATNTFQAGNQYDSDPLTKLGTEDARRLAERLAELPIDVIVSSSYLRARTTAGAIADATGAPHLVPVWKGSSWVDLPAKDPELRDHVSLLREIDVPSELQGLRFDDPRAREIQHAALAVADQPEVHYSDEENLYDLWRRAEEMRRYLEARTERLIVVVAHGGINKVWLAHLMFTAVAGLDTPTQLAAYRGFTRLGWWDNTGVLSLRFSPQQGWMWLMTDIQHLQPEYFSFMPSARTLAVSHPDAGAEYLGGEDGGS